MADVRRGVKELKRDQQVRREVLDDIGSEVDQAAITPQYRNPNRDQARGDWDRSRRHTDEGNTRDNLSGGDTTPQPPDE